VTGALRALRRPRLWLAVWLLMIALVCIGSLLPARDLPQAPFIGFDKVEHILGYAVLSAYAMALFARGRGQWLAASGLVLLGIALEGAQGAWTTSRSPDAFDVLADALGVALGLLLAWTPVATALQRLDAHLR
jgi:VanZ family protein